MFSKLTSFTHQGEAPASQEQGESLVTVLPTHEDRTNLLLLIVSSIEVMHNRILAAFDPEKTGNAPPLRLQSSKGHGSKGDDDHSAAQQDVKEGSNILEATDEAREAAAKAQQARLKEVSGPEMMALKQAAVNHFDSWRERVTQRIAEAVNQRPDQAKIASKTKSEQGSHQPRKDTSPEDAKANTALHHLYPPQDTPLSRLDQAQRVLILHSLLLILLGLESYPAESRILMLHIASSLSLPLSLLSEDENQVAKGLLEAAKQQMNADKETKEKAESSAASRKWKVGLGAAAGAVLIGVTGGLAAPVLAAGVGSVMGGIGLGATATAGYLGALAGSAPLVGVLFGAYGGRMTGQMVDKYAKEVEDFAFIPVHKPSLLHAREGDKSARHLRVAIGISGWLTEEAEVVQPWQVISNGGIEAFALRWELKVLLNLGHAITTYIKSYAWGWAKKEIISRTIFAALSSALASALTMPYGIAKATKLVDNPFSLARSRSEKAGEVLADALINKVQGERPVTLMGYSLGARVIYTCLNQLADRKAFGLVESVVLIGSPTPSDSLAWRKIRSVVSGRVVNVYSTNDYLLGFLYRTSSLQYGVAGLQAIPNVEGIENVDVSEIVDGHTQYRFLLGSILQKIGFEDIDAEVVEKEIKRLQKEEEKVKQEQEKQQAEGKKNPEAEADEMQHEIEQKSKASQAMDWMSNKMSGLKMPGQEEKRAGTAEESPATQTDVSKH